MGIPTDCPNMVTPHASIASAVHYRCMVTSNIIIMELKYIDDDSHLRYKHCYCNTNLAQKLTFQSIAENNVKIIQINTLVIEKRYKVREFNI